MWISGANYQTPKLVPSCSRIAVRSPPDGQSEQMESRPSLLLGVPSYLREGERIVEVVRGCR